MTKHNKTAIRYSCRQAITHIFCVPSSIFIITTLTIRTMLDIKNVLLRSIEKGLQQL